VGRGARAAGRRSSGGRAPPHNHDAAHRPHRTEILRSPLVCAPASLARPPAAAQEGLGRKRLQSLFKSESDERASQMPTAKLARATTLHNLQRSAKHGTTFRNLRTGHAANGSPLGSPLHAPGGNKMWKSAAEQSSNGGVKRNSGHQRISGGDGLNFHLPSKLTAAAAAHGGGGCGAHGDGSSFALPKDEMPKDEMPKDELQQLQDSLMTGLTKDELTLLAAAPCPVVATAQRIQRAIITRQHAGGICAPPPIVSRIFQEISNGLLAYNNATKMKEVPVPFEYVQLNAYLLNTMAILAPIAISAFTASFVLAVIATFVVVGSFYAIFIVANDMEDPFGNQLNDMPMLSYHEEFCATIYAFLTNAWLPEDQWLVRDGPWVDPASLANTASAFWDSIGKKDQAKVNHVRGKIAPFASLLNNQKMVNSQPNDQEPSLVQRMIRRVAPPVKTHRLPHVLSFPGEQATAGFEKKRVEKSAKVVQRYARGYLSRQTLLKRGVSLRKLPSGFCGAGSFSKGGGKARNSVDEKPSPVQVGDPSTAWEGGAPAADGLQTSTRGSRCGSCSWGRSSRCGSCSEGAVASRYSTGGGTASRRARFSSRDSMGGDGSSRGPMGSTKDMAARVKRGSVACAKSAKVAFAKVAPQPITIIQ